MSTFLNIVYAFLSCVIERNIGYMERTLMSRYINFCGKNVPTPEALSDNRKPEKVCTLTFAHFGVKMYYYTKILTYSLDGNLFNHRIN